MNNTYISYIIQSAENHVHDFEVLDIPKSKFAIYADNTAQQVVKWASQKQSQLQQGKKIIILNFFSINNIE